MRTFLASLVCSLSLFTATAEAQVAQGAGRPIACEALLDLPYVTLTRATPRPATATAPAHCYVQGTIDARIRFHMQLPLPGNWNGRLLNIGDGGKDGVLNFADQRLAQGTRWPTPIPGTTRGRAACHIRAR